MSSYFQTPKMEHERRLLHVLQQLREYGLKLSPSKCCFFSELCAVFGPIVSSKGVETDPEKVSALFTWPRPKTLTELKSFLGFAGYYRWFVKDLSKIVKLLNDLTRRTLLGRVERQLLPPQDTGTSRNLLLNDGHQLVRKHFKPS